MFLDGASEPLEPSERERGIPKRPRIIIVHKKVGQIHQKTGRSCLFRENHREYKKRVYVSHERPQKDRTGPTQIGTIPAHWIRVWRNWHQRRVW